MFSNRLWLFLCTEQWLLGVVLSLGGCPHPAAVTHTKRKNSSETEMLITPRMCGHTSFLLIRGLTRFVHKENSVSSESFDSILLLLSCILSLCLALMQFKEKKILFHCDFESSVCEGHEVLCHWRFDVVRGGRWSPETRTTESAKRTSPLTQVLSWLWTEDQALHSLGAQFWSLSLISVEKISFLGKLHCTRDVSSLLGAFFVCLFSEGLWFAVVSSGSSWD